MKKSTYQVGIVATLNASGKALRARVKRKLKKEGDKFTPKFLQVCPFDDTTVFFFNTKIQSFVEQAMLLAGFGCSDYTLGFAKLERITGEDCGYKEFEKLDKKAKKW